MKEGSLYLVMSFPMPWPPLDPTPLYSSPSGVSMTTLFALPGGHLKFVVEESGHEIVHYESQPIHLAGTGHTLLCIVWENSIASLWLNSASVLSRDAARDVAHTVVLANHSFESTPSFHHRDAIKACQKWMNWRKSRYASPKILAKKDRRLKSEAEQVEELKRCIAGLSGLTAMIHQGKDYYLGYLATTLRSLIYWNGKNYNPLLIRLAGRFTLPLPIFMLPEGKIALGSGLGPVHRFEHGEPSLIKRLPTHELNDIQEWLETNTFTAFFERQSEGGLIQETRSITVKDLLLNTATTMGVAHYDDDIPDSLEMFYNLKGSNYDMATSLLLKTSSLVVELGNYVVASAHVS